MARRDLGMEYSALKISLFSTEIWHTNFLIMDGLFEKLGILAGVGMPLWNIPLVVRIVRRKDSRDISLWWAFGVWACMLLMLPSSLHSQDMVLKVFGICNVVFFSMVVIAVVAYRKGPS
jgi:hypothetical protein